MRYGQAKLPLFIIAIVFFIVAFIGLFYTDDYSSLSSTSILKLNKPCSSQETITNDLTPQKKITSDLKSDDSAKGSSVVPEDIDNIDVDDEELLINKCDLAKGRWVFNNLSKPLYSDRTCQYLDKQISCVKNGRMDSGYRHWEWQPDNCIFPRFDPQVVLDKLKGKRLMFVGDSLQRNQWQSFVCLVESVIPADQKSMRRGHAHSVFKAKEYNSTIEFYWAPFLIESNSDLDIIADPRKRILKVDSVSKHAQYWIGVDILVFNTYIWWMNGIKIKSLWGSFANGEDGFEELEEQVAYRIGLKTWANWIDSTVDPNKTRVFFTTMSPTHIGSLDRHEKKGFRCYNETRPFLEYWGSDLNRRVMDIVASVVQRMKIPVQFINITQMSEHRIDGHASVYAKTQGKVVTDEQKADPKHNSDCIHWCLPGVPDTWNRLFYTYL
ncbi:PMR5 N-terminal domain [Macleaya cordata]|uniref:PMR5 N-terminal domain n=1 Tax=Macleaya cordata TaxID=56857 RepID=A0A200PLN7_MACCD|nr:PMR5 N-terminal domain [Macleaya cordata]